MNQECGQTNLQNKIKINNFYISMKLVIINPVPLTTQLLECLNCVQYFQI